MQSLGAKPAERFLIGMGASAAGDCEEQLENNINDVGVGVHKKGFFLVRKGFFREKKK